MQLSKFTDYSFRVLITLASKKTEGLATAEELAKELNTSEHHLKKVVQRLAQKGYIKSMKGRNGGLVLAKTPEEINLGDVLLDMEENMNIVGCFGTEKDCPFQSKSCKLKGIITNSLSLFIGNFSKNTLADIL